MPRAAAPAPWPLVRGVGCTDPSDDGYRPPGSSLAWPSAAARALAASVERVGAGMERTFHGIPVIVITARMSQARRGLSDFTMLERR